MEQHQARTPFGLDQPLPPGRLSGHLRDQRTEILLVGGQLHQQTPHLVHIEDVAGTQLIQLSQEVAEWARESASAHLPTFGRIRPRPGLRVFPSADASAMAWSLPRRRLPEHAALVHCPDSTARHRAGHHPSGVNTLPGDARVARCARLVTVVEQLIRRASSSGTGGYFKMLTARAITRPRIMREPTACTVMASLAHRASGITSVGLNAVASVKPR